MSVRIAGIDFDNVLYDGDVDVLYLTVGEPRPTSDFDASPEGDYLRYGERGGLFGVSIVNARRRLERERKITITLPAQRVEVLDFGDVLARAYSAIRNRAAFADVRAWTQTFPRPLADGARAGRAPDALVRRPRARRTRGEPERRPIVANMRRRQRR